MGAFRIVVQADARVSGMITKRTLSSLIDNIMVNVRSAQKARRTGELVRPLFRNALATEGHNP